MTISYLIVAPLAWLIAGNTKFLINSIAMRQPAWKGIGLGGIPSTHTAVATSPAWLILLAHGPKDATLAVAVAFALVVVIDALDTRRRIGDANAVLRAAFPHDPLAQRLRERTGHSLIEVVAGVAVGGVAALAAIAAGTWV